MPAADLVWDHVRGEVLRGGGDAGVLLHLAEQPPVPEHHHRDIHQHDAVPGRPPPGTVQRGHPQEVPGLQQASLPVEPVQKAVRGTGCLTQVPVYLEWLYRAILNRLVNPDFEHNLFFTFFSATLFSLSTFRFLG